MGAYILRPKFFLFCTYSGIKGWLVGRLVNKASKKTNGKVYVMIYMHVCTARTSIKCISHIVLTNLEESLLSTQVWQQTQLLLKSVMVWTLVDQI